MRFGSRISSYVSIELRVDASESELKSRKGQRDVHVALLNLSSTEAVVSVSRKDSDASGFLVVKMSDGLRHCSFHTASTCLQRYLRPLAKGAEPLCEVRGSLRLIHLYRCPALCCRASCCFVLFRLKIWRFVLPVVASSTVVWSYQAH